MIDHVLRYIAPAGYSLLPAKMDSPAATAMLLAIGLQESRFHARRQGEDGPARGFWQFERNGVRAVLRHQASRQPIADALSALMYVRGGSGWGVTDCHTAIEHNDVLAFCFARALLFTVRAPLPGPTDVHQAWLQYMESWRPGAPHRETWDAFYSEAWTRVETHSLNGRDT